ncbi:MAG: hypothetical protein BEN19_00465 [Epulopiscium sp. Nuni2H_MBin003]|nr:MAG: hypothetical protein BEN19_00465 [Epulopiscium sp. Nuni2H_MBin003]
MIKWQDSYKVGIDMVDEQHKVLFDIVIQTEHILNQYAYDKYDSIIELLQKLKEYTIFHFEQEEEIMIKANYNKFFEHKVLHTDFIEKLEELVGGVDIQTDDEVIKNILIFLIEWLTEHILKVDKNMAKKISDI